MSKLSVAINFACRLNLVVFICFDDLNRKQDLKCFLLKTANRGMMCTVCFEWMNVHVHIRFQPQQYRVQWLFCFLSNAFLPVSLSGSYTVGWRDPVRSVATRLPPSLPPFGETQDRPHPLHDWMVYVCLLQDAALGLGAACLGHVPLWR